MEKALFIDLLTNEEFFSKITLIGKLKYEDKNLYRSLSLKPKPKAE